jgi:hypothetical protein
MSLRSARDDGANVKTLLSRKNLFFNTYMALAIVCPFILVIYKILL